MLEPLTVSFDFPTLDDVSKDAYSLRIISPAYASRLSELNTTLQYIYHYFFFERAGDREAATLIMRIALCEMIHLELLGKAVLRLGAAPVYTSFPPDCFSFYSTKYVSYSGSLKNMIEDDIIGERLAISGYEKMLTRLKNPAVKSLIERVLQDEKLHLSELEKLRLSRFDKSDKK